MVIEVVGPGAAAIGTLSQSRALTEVTVIAPGPSPSTDFRSSVNSWPPVVTPHGCPRIAWSTVYEPPPLSTTSRPVFPNPPSHVPAWMLAPGVPGVHSDSFAVSSWNVTLIPRAGADSLRLNTIGTLTHGCAAVMQSPLGSAATVDPGDPAKMLSV